MFGVSGMSVCHYKPSIFMLGGICNQFLFELLTHAERPASSLLPLYKPMSLALKVCKALL
jgi:hypothetical protein